MDLRERERERERVNPGSTAQREKVDGPTDPWYGFRPAATTLGDGASGSGST
jgi:hypothetical protein